VKEVDFQRWVTDVAKRFGWRVWHVPSPMRAADRDRGWVGAREAAGLPDLIMFHEDPPCLIFAELKGTGGKLTDAQQEFLRLARLVAEPVESDFGDFVYAPVGVYAWKPGDEDAVETILRSKIMA